jgi:hypothetical protein
MSSRSIQEVTGGLAAAPQQRRNSSGEAAPGKALRYQPGHQHVDDGNLWNWTPAIWLFPNCRETARKIAMTFAS